MPWAARADSKNLRGAVVVRMSVNVVGKDEHPSPSLRHSEPSSVQYPVGPPIPCLAQRCEESPKVSALIAGEESGDVLHEEPCWSVLGHKIEEGEGESASGEAAVIIAESGPSSCDGEVGAGKAA